MTQLHGKEEAEKAAMAHRSPRYCRLEQLERWVTGTQYVGRRSWWDDSVPLWERAPCVVYPIVQIGIRSNTDLCLGEGRFPSFEIKHTGQGAETDSSEDQADPVSDYLGHYHRLSRFAAAARESFDAAQGCGTAVSIHGVRNGIPFTESLPAKWCERTLDADGELETLEIRYSYTEEYKRRDGKWAVRAMLYRRLITKTDDTVFKPVEANSRGIEPSWTVDDSQSISHNLGFVPAVWYAFMRGTQPVNVIDGQAIHQWTTDEIQAHDIARSQWHRGALLSEPQMYEIGVTRGYNPTGSGRKALVPTTEKGGAATPDNPITGAFVEGGSRTEEARKKGPGYVLQYENKDTKVGVLEYSAGALEAQRDNVSDLRIKIQEALAVVFLDPENIKFAATTSGKALQAIKQKQIDRCSLYREDFRDGYLLPSIILQLRLTRSIQDLRVPGIKEALAALGDKEISAPEIEVRYGDFYQPDPAEQKQIIELVASAKKEGLITRKVAVEEVASIFGIRDTSALLRELDKERDEEEERAAGEFKRMMNESGKQLPPNPQDVPKGSGSGRPPNGQINAGQ